MQSEYKRLCRGGRKSGLTEAYFHSLWIGKDHLLSIKRANFRDDYLRFYFKDIQSVALEQTNRWIAVIIFFIGLGLIFIPVFIAAKNEIGMAAIILPGIFFVVALIQFFLGPSCKVVIKTAAHSVELPCLGRIKKATRAMNILRPLIEANQGQLLQEQWAAESNEFVASIKEEVLLSNKTKKATTAYLVSLAFTILLVGADLIYNFGLLTASILASFGATGVSAIIVTADAPKKSAQRRLAILVSTYAVIVSVSILVTSIAVTVENPQSADEQWKAFNLLAQQSALWQPWMWAQISTIVFSTIFLIFGLAYRPKQSVHHPASS